MFREDLFYFKTFIWRLCSIYFIYFWQHEWMRSCTIVLLVGVDGGM